MPKGTNNLIFYSVNTKLAHHINDEYYGGIHYVWCSPIFDPTTSGKYTSFSATGPTSNPHEIYCELRKHVQSTDRHSAKIEENKIGLIRGAASQMRKGVIDATDFGHIKQVVDNAERIHFTPYIYIIPAMKISKHRLKRVSPDEAATIMGTEYKIEDLKNSEFDIIEIR